jgi:dephospho-CoA kinase
MSETRRILLVGLTGGVASGKTTVSHIFAEHGAFVVDADALAHEAIAPGGSAYEAVVDRFGREILDDRGYVVRSRLADLVFHDDDARAALNAIVHPRVRGEFDRRLAAYVPSGHAPIAVFDAALLVESGTYADFHRLVVTRCDQAAQIRRMTSRSGLSIEEARARIAAQAPLEHKLALADYVIDTDGTLLETRAQTERVFVELVEDYEQEFGQPG